MPNSFSVERILTCDHCGGTFAAEVWLIVDTGEQPNLAARLADNTLYQFVCTHCHQEQYVDLPVLVYRPGEPNPLLYGMVDALDEQTQAELAQDLAYRLAEGLGAVWQEKWVEGGVPSLPRGAVSVLVSFGRPAQTTQQEQRAPRQNWEVMQQAELELQIYRAFESFFELESAGEIYHYLLAHPVLLRDEADALLSTLILNGRERGMSEQELLLLERKRDLLRRSHAVGTARAVVENLVASGKAVITGEEKDLPDVVRALLFAPATGKAGGETEEEEAKQLGKQAFALLRKYELAGDSSDLDAGLHALQEAAKRTPLESLDRSMYLLNLATALRYRYIRSGQQAAADAALVHLEEVMAATPAASPRWPVYLKQLALLDHARFQMSGKLEELEGAISLFREALARAGEGAAIRPALLVDLGRAVQDRYVKTGDLADLNEAIALHKAAVTITPRDTPELSGYVESLGGALLDQYRHSGERSELEEAIACFYFVHERTPAHSIAWWRVSAMLYSAFFDHYLLTRRRSELDFAIAGMIEVVRHSRPKDKVTPDRLVQLARAVRERYELTHDPEELEFAIALYRQALTLTPHLSPAKPFFLANLGLALRDRCRASPEAAECTEAVELFEQACQLGLERAFEATLKAAENWGAWAGRRGAWPEAARAYDYGLQALDHLYAAQLLETDRAVWLKTAPLLIANAAYALARSGRAIEAVTVLERGYVRGLHRALLRFDLNLERLREAEPNVYRRLQQVTQSLQNFVQLERLAEMVGDQPSGAVDWVRHLAPARVARDELAMVMQHTRQMLGDADDDESTWAQVAALVEPGSALVYLLASQHGGLAIALHRTDPGGPVVATPLWVQEFTNLALITSLISGKEEGSLEGYLSALFLRDHDLLTQALVEILPESGRRLLFDLVTHLQHVGVKTLTLIPGGSLRLLPLHALPCDEEAASTLLDLFTVRYAPSAGVLASCQRRLAARPVAVPTLLAVGNPVPLPPGVPALFFAEREIDALAHYFGGRCVKLRKAEATPDAVMAKMAEASHIHLACHSRFDPLKPYASSLQLSGMQLGILDIQKQSLDHTRLIVLSACETAISGLDIPDEITGIVAAFLEMGAPAVVGSMWEVDDLSTGLLMQEFYRMHLTERQGVAEALSAAQHWLRNATAEELALAEQWEQLYHDHTRPHSFRVHAFRQMRYYRRHPDARPFVHPYYWAAFVAVGAV